MASFPSHIAVRLAQALLIAGPALAIAQPIVVQGLECRSDEPAWRLDASRSSAQFSTTVPRKREVVFRGSLQALPGEPALLVWRGDTTHLPRETVVLVAREEACQMAVPGIPNGTHRALLSIRGGEAVTGCCVARAGYDARVAPAAAPAAKSPDDWSRGVVDLTPALNACATREGARFRAVTSARVDGGKVRVRMRETDGKDVDCVVDANGRGTPAIGPATGDAPARGPWWYPVREPAPIVACGKLERVLNTRGGATGYLQYDPC